LRRSSRETPSLSDQYLNSWSVYVDSFVVVSSGLRQIIGHKDFLFGGLRSVSDGVPSERRGGLRVAVRILGGR
jgi:hypothetical protein